MTESSFGKRLCEAVEPVDFLKVEAESGLSEQFREVELVVAGILIRAIRGERVVQLSRKDRTDTIRIIGIPEALQESLRSSFQLEQQQARGAWFLPEAVRLNAQPILFSAWFREAPSYAHALSGEETGKCSLLGNPDAMVLWSVLEPLAQLLLAPVFLRVEESGLLTRDEFQARWVDIETTLGKLGVDLREQLQPLSWGGGWARFTAQEQIACQTSFLRVLDERMSGEVVRRYRALMIRELIEQYYSKAKNGRAKRRKVITKEYAPHLASFFGGDWLAFIRYLGEEPHEEEQVVTALPEPRVFVAGADRAGELARSQGVPSEEVERILRSFWQDSRGNSPIIERAAVLGEFWRAFDEVHARQSSGQQALWGLIDDGGGKAALANAGQAYQGISPYYAGLYQRLFPPDLLSKVERLWGTTVLQKWPDRVVTEPFPHFAMAETFGAAIKFWHGCSLTAWYICEGPFSRTDIPGLAHYYRNEVSDLALMKCPISASFFRELESVRLGPEEAIYQSKPSSSTGLVSIQVQYTMGSRRSGFERLRDVITRHRRIWASEFLEAYARACWDNELKATARQFHLMTEEKGKSPTLKQFAKHAVDPARHWFGGDVGLLYGSLGQKLPGNGVSRNLRMPKNRTALVDVVFRELGGTINPPMDASRPVDERHTLEINRNRDLRRLAVECLTYVQILEALERPPSLKEFGARFVSLSGVISKDQDAAWSLFSVAIERALASLSS